MTFRSAAGPDADPQAFPSAPIRNLKLRAELLAKTRRFLTARGYWEVETPILSHDVSVDAHLDPFETEYAYPGGCETPAAAGDPQPVSVAGKTTHRLYLQTSPEFGMKRLLAAGAEAIFQITRSFRNGELGPWHNPEFTIVEWYRAGADYQELMTEVGALVGELLGTAPPDRVTYRDAFREHAGCDPFTATEEELSALARRHGFSGPSGDVDELLDFLLAALVQPRLGIGRPTLLCDYPATQAALARVSVGPPPVAQRFELFLSGVELCNGAQELTDATELRHRSVRQNLLRRDKGKRTLPVDSHLLRAMQAGLPECAGVAMGLDRLVMLAAGARTLAEVLAFDFDRA